MVRSITALGSEFRSHCKKLSAERRFYTKPTHHGSAHVEIIGDTYHYVVTERGSEFERRKTHDSDELMYWLLYDVVFDLAASFEVEHRMEGRDFRRLMFEKEVEYMAILSPHWAQRVSDHNATVLEQHPFSDL
jgi:hypothetical protein